MSKKTNKDFLDETAEEIMNDILKTMLTVTDKDITTFLKEPPLGLKPRFVIDSERMTAIVEAMSRYANAGKFPPSEWVQELLEICEREENRYKKI